ncbi:MAG: ATP-binding protein, partial [Nitrospirota bacterium]
ASEVKGVPYFKIIPRIRKGAQDAVLHVLKTGKPLILAGLTSKCFYGRTRSDIYIAPQKALSGNVDSARINIKQSLACSAIERLGESKRFLDIGKIAATLAHGVRSPLNAIKGAVVYIREKYVSERQLIEFTKIIEDEITRLDSFIARFLSTSICDEGFYETDINAALKKIEVLIFYQARSHKIETFFKYGKTFPVMVNSFQIELAILNVISNALEAMPLGGKLAVATKSDVQSGKEFTVIEIKDTGCGMVRGKSSTFPSEKKGKGLGLFITREILKSLGGHLEIKSKKGQGTTVKMYLPKG